MLTLSTIVLSYLDTNDMMLYQPLINKFMNKDIELQNIRNYSDELTEFKENLELDILNLKTPDDRIWYISKLLHFFENDNSYASRAKLHILHEVATKFNRIIS